MSWKSIERKMDILVPNQATCQICNLTARNNEELADHVRHAHGPEMAK
jgi:hypothetical protein